MSRADFTGPGPAGWLAGLLAGWLVVVLIVTVAARGTAALVALTTAAKVRSTIRLFVSNGLAPLLGATRQVPTYNTTQHDIV